MKRSEPGQERGPSGPLPAPRRRRPNRRRPAREGAPGGAGPDLWALLAVAYAGGAGRGVGLNTVRYVAGIIRQATLTDEYLREELGRLQATGLVEVRDGRYHPTEPFLEFFRTRANRRSVRDDYEDLVEYLGLRQPEGGGEGAPGP